jgi:hypothetical protein
MDNLRDKQHAVKQEAIYGWRVEPWSRAVGCSRARTYELIAEKKIESVKLGWARIIRTHPETFLDSLVDGAA